MFFSRVERDGIIKECLWVHFDLPPHRLKKGHSSFVYVNDQGLAIPMQLAWTNLKALFVAINPFAASLSHCPTFFSWAIDGNIQAAVLIWIGRTLLICPSIVWRKNTTNKSDDRNAVQSIITDCIDVPPQITTMRDYLVKAWRSMRVAAANRPDRAAIGTPGPG